MNEGGRDRVVFQVDGGLLRTSTAILPLAIIAALAVVRMGNEYVYLTMVNEDRLVEHLTAVFYVLAGLVALPVALGFLRSGRRFPAVMYFLFALALIGAGGEEISWGERMLRLSPPEFFRAHNVQGEMNIHNLAPFQVVLHEAYVAVGLYGALAWLLLRSRAGTFRALVNPYFIPDWYLAGFFLPVAFIYLVFDFSPSGILPWGLTPREQEPAEMLLSMGFLLFVIIGRFRQIRDLGLRGPRWLAASHTAQ